MTRSAIESKGTVSQQVSRFICQVGHDAVPEEVRAAAKLRILDTIGVAVAGLDSSSGVKILDVVRNWGGGLNAVCLGTASRVPMASAGLVNGTLAHSLDFDDTHLESRIHPSTVVVPAVLSVGDAVGTGGREVVTAAVVGFEILIRIGLAAPGRFHERGWHATSACGALAAAGITARLLGLDEVATWRAIGIAASTASGLREAYLGEATDTKAFHAGWAVHGGIVAAELAGGGFTGPVTSLEGRFGYYRAFVAPDEYDLSRIVEGLGSEWLTGETTFKLFPCGSLSHACIDSALEIARTHKVKPSEVEEVVCRVPPGMVSTVLEPAAVKLQPRSGYEAKFSLQFAVAAALVRGRVALEEFTDRALADPGIREVLAKVRYEVDPDMPFPAKYPGAVTLRTVRGDTWVAHRANSPGTKERPITEEEIVEKFRLNLSGRVEVDVIDQLTERLLRLDDEEQLGGVLAMLQNSLGPEGKGRPLGMSTVGEP